MSKEWANLPGIMHSKATMEGYNPKRTSEVMLLNREKVRIMTSFLTGHCKLGKHLRQLGIIEEGECSFCRDSARLRCNNSAYVETYKGNKPNCGATPNPEARPSFRLPTRTNNYGHTLE